MRCFASLQQSGGQPCRSPSPDGSTPPFPKELSQAGFAEVCFYKLFLPVQQVKEL